ncbi:hypothetical protein SAMN05661044_05143 [Olivibacter domesticus]|uniref:Uncharacterized protein n=1 Tax=Olivibacter domesticus TaxID=407022 RepID=A0A1H7Y7B8_OLID1|nr:hypothetical protein SAMN05661044_05143 [Olivibacter domesticus]
MNKSQSPNFKNGKYHNLSFTPTMAKGDSFLRILKEQLHKPKTVVPSYTIPSVITLISLILIKDGSLGRIFHGIIGGDHRFHQRDGLLQQV